MDHDLITKIKILGYAKIQQPKIYKRDQLTFSLSWKNKNEQSKQHKIMHDKSIITRDNSGRISISFPTQSKTFYPCERCQVSGWTPTNCSYTLRMSISQRIYLIEEVAALGDNFVQSANGCYNVGQWVVQKLWPEDIEPIESVITWSNYNNKAQNKILNNIAEKQEQKL